MTSYNNVSFPNAEMTMIMQPTHANAQGSVHGGDLMKIMDNMAGVVAIRHAKPNVVTARVDELVFVRPVKVGDIITCIGQLSYVGNSSMQVIVKVFVRNIEDYSEVDLAISAFFTMVHLENGKPVATPKLIPETEEEKELYALGERKYLEIKKKFK